MEPSRSAKPPSREGLDKLFEEHPAVLDGRTRERVRCLLDDVRPANAATIEARGRDLIDAALAIDDAAGTVALALAVLAFAAREGVEPSAALESIDRAAMRGSDAPPSDGCHGPFSERVIETLREAGYVARRAPR